MKILESEVSTGNMTGQGGGGSMPFNRGYYFYGGNNGEPGIAFTPTGEPSFKTYKSMKHSKKELKKRLKKRKMMKKFENFLIEDVAATMGNSGGMGAVTAATPSSTPGDVAGSTPGSGDIGQTLGTYTKPMLNQKKGKKKLKRLTSFDDFKNK